MNDMRPGYNSDSFSAKITDSLSAEQLGDKQRLAAYSPKEYYPLAALTADEQNELATLRIDIHNFAQEQAAAWIVKGGVEKEYDAFVKQLESMGLRRLEEIYQAAYNRYRGK
jgi:putative aldouronate transport system substrate-binding protein